MSAKSEAYKRDLGNPAFRNSPYWESRENMKKQGKCQKNGKKQCQCGKGLKNGARNGAKNCDSEGKA